MSIHKTQNFTPISNPWKQVEKMHPEKLICQKLLQICSIEEGNPQFCILFSPITFLLVNFQHFSQQFRNQRNILHCFDTNIQILWKMVLIFCQTCVVPKLHHLLNGVDLQSYMRRSIAYHLLNGVDLQSYMRRSIAYHLLNGVDLQSYMRRSIASPPTKWCWSSVVHASIHSFTTY